MIFTQHNTTKMSAQTTNNLISSFFDRSLIFIYIFAGSILGLIIMKLPFLAVSMVLGLFIIIAFAKMPLGALSLFVLIFPFSASIYLRDPVIVKGTEPINLIALIVIFFFLINIKNSVKMPRYAFIFIIVILTIFSIAALRSLANLDLINYRNIADGREALSPLAHTLKTWIRPLFSFFPFIVVLKLVKNEENIEFIVKVILTSIILYSICVLFIYFFLVPGGGIVEAADRYHTYMGLQRNELADYLMIGLPFFIARYFLHKSLFSIFNIFIIICAIGFTFTRTAYVTTILTFLFYLIISKRSKFLPVLIVFSFCLTFFVSSAIMERATKGFSSGDRDEISSGRIDKQWLPLIEEYLENPYKLMFGNGRFSIVSSKYIAQGVIPDTMMHPHNMYLEQIIDAGIFAAILIFSLYAFIFLKIFHSLKAIKNRTIREYQYAVIVSLSSFFIAGITGRTLFPLETNGLLFIIMGLGIVITRLAWGFHDNIGEYSYEGIDFTS